ncbi:helix-turn-helix domain-containing protein [Gorillibacterium sp. sgz500922]|uniref:helix-turn-helix domain-containing protein n=1 Tax=Gorillibacterium sp. sgz500922 TaxID=3446694 RepID=UPI003F6772F2
MNISESVTKAMIEQKLNPSDVARKTGYSPQYLHSLLDGRRRWNESILAKTCDVLGLEIKLVPKQKVGAR